MKEYDIFHLLSANPGTLQAFGKAYYISVYMCLHAHTLTHIQTHKHIYINWWDIHKILEVHLLSFVFSFFITLEIRGNKRL